MVTSRDRKPTVLSAETVSASEIQQVEDPPTLIYRWTIEDFSRLETKKLYSQIFHVGGYEWRVLIFPKGNDVDYLSIYLDVADSATLPYGWSRYAKFSLAVVNQIHGKHTILKSTQHHFNGQESDWGFTSFMSLSELYDPSRGYLVDDTCVIEAKVIDNVTGYVGLKKQGATDYMNSLLQTLYYIRYFRKAIYHIPTTEDDMPSGSIPLALQSLFYKLQHSDNSVATKELTKSFGWDTDDSFMQRDVQEFNRFLCEKLEDKMKGTVVEGTIQYLFEGHYENYIKCINVNYKSARKESFYDLQLDVKGCQDVYDSFDKYVKVERLEADNKYQAGNLGLQDADKGVRFIDFPPVLQLHLKCFEYDIVRHTSVKINDRYEFPLQLDLDKYLSPRANKTVRNVYTLHSVLVHNGIVLGGHYYAFIRPTLSHQWFMFDNEKVTKDDTKKALGEHYRDGEELPQTNPGSNNTHFKFTKYSNAYMLVYIRESDKEKIMCAVDEKDFAEHLRIRLKKEQEEKEHKKKEKAEAQLYPIIKERKLEPNVMYEHIDKRISIKSSQLEDGDMICYQKSLTFARYPNDPSFLEFVRNLQNMDTNLVAVTKRRLTDVVGPSSFPVVPSLRNLQPDSSLRNWNSRNLKPEEHNRYSLYTNNRRSVVFVSNLGARQDFSTGQVLEVPQGFGSGFMWDRRGYIVTNYHVIHNAFNLRVRLPDQLGTYEAKFMGCDQDNDVAVLLIDAPSEKLWPIKDGTSSNLCVGLDVCAIGHPFGLEYTWTPGVISGLGVNFTSPANGMPIRDGILTNALINPGNSGGPLLDSSGYLIGIVTAIKSQIGESCGVAFAVPVDTVKGIVDQIVNFGEVRRPISGDSRSFARRSQRVSLVIKQK